MHPRGGVSGASFPRSNVEIPNTNISGQEYSLSGPPDERPYTDSPVVNLVDSWQQVLYSLFGVYNRACFLGYRVSPPSH